MKLVDLIVELDKKNGTGVYTSHELRKIEQRLFECEEFKQVVRINYIDLPAYLVDTETDEPISSNREFLGGNTGVRQVGSFRVEPNQELKLNKIVDLYSISILKRYSVAEEIDKPGIWVYPTIYDPNVFTPKNQIRVIWDPSQLNEALTLMGGVETPKQRLLRMFETALDTMEPNLPCEYVLSFRCSTRSINNPDEIKVVEAPRVEIPKEPTIDLSSFEPEVKEKFQFDEYKTLTGITAMLSISGDFGPK